ncbi:MAG: ribosomal-protein-alanine N-acetyltransferase [Chloroflexi bacterium]|nr:MAG: ribosomal-protein-alanine N-acetyltransferase [Chloroflexota bacterium]
MLLADVPRVHAIDVLSFSMPWSERSYRFEVTENRNSLVLVAERVENEAPPELVGMIVIWVIIDEAHVATIATHPDYRGQGIGRRLLANGLLAASERGARLAYLEVRRGNQVAQELYKKFGFQVVGERLRYYQDNNEDALLMTLDPIVPELLQQFAV